MISFLFFILQKEKEFERSGVSGRVTIIYYSLVNRYLRLFISNNGRSECLYISLMSTSSDSPLFIGLLSIKGGFSNETQSNFTKKIINSYRRIHFD